MKKFEFVYTFIPEPEVETGIMEIEAESEEEAREIFDATCEDEVLDIKRIVHLGEPIDPNQLAFEQSH